MLKSYIDTFSGLLEYGGLTQSIDIDCITFVLIFIKFAVPCHIISVGTNINV